MLASVRSPAPLLDKGYRTPEVLAALGQTFYSKCYMCETAYTEPNSFHVEHLLGQTANPGMVTDWENLFLACDACNLIKPRACPPGGYLNPCVAADAVETRIKYELEFVAVQRGVRPRFLPLDQDPRTINTCNLLERVHNGHDPNSIARTANLRDSIALRAELLLLEMLEHYRAVGAADGVRIARAEGRIRTMLSRTAPYTMLMRSLVAPAEAHFAVLFD